MPGVFPKENVPVGQRRWICPLCGSIILLPQGYDGLVKFGCCEKVFDIRPAYVHPRPLRLTARDCVCGKTIFTLSRHSGFIKTKCCGRIFLIRPDDSALLSGESIPKGEELLDLKKFTYHRVVPAAV
ncbi:MAG: hypothetical protein U1D31_01430 [Patescibacteria group bacterium]|nr:hypothetical protein [bacterium]MDZ4240769.1 hypothetical protein [Patescibacteria group bacterium]